MMPEPEEESTKSESAEVRRLNWGCGTRNVPEGWVNSDIKAAPGIQVVCDITEGLPLEDSSFDYVVSIHALPELAYEDLRGALGELWRVLEPGGTLRLALPDMEKAIRAYLDRDAGYFLVPDDDVRSLGGKMIVQLTWYGFSRSMFTFDYIEELLYGAGFVRVSQCGFGETGSSYPEIVELDDREREGLFVEAVK
jgi:SAM-dependent methyltransferase